METDTGWILKDTPGPKWKNNRNGLWNNALTHLKAKITQQWVWPLRWKRLGNAQDNNNNSKRQHWQHGVSCNRLGGVTNVVPLPRQRSKMLNKWCIAPQSWEHKHAIVLPASEPWWQWQWQKHWELLWVVLMSGRWCRWKIIINRWHGELLFLFQGIKLTLYTLFSGTAGTPDLCHVMVSNPQGYQSTPSDKHRMCVKATHVMSFNKSIHNYHFSSYFLIHFYSHFRV